MNKWNTLVEYINKQSIGEVILRGELISATNNNVSYNTSVDNQRNWLTKCGYLKRIKDGKYKVMKHIELHLTSNEMKKMAYDVEYRTNHDRFQKITTILNED